MCAAIQAEETGGARACHCQPQTRACAMIGVGRNDACSGPATRGIVGAGGKGAVPGMQQQLPEMQQGGSWLAVLAALPGVRGPLMEQMMPSVLPPPPIGSSIIRPCSRSCNAITQEKATASRCDRRRRRSGLPHFAFWPGCCFMLANRSSASTIARRASQHSQCHDLRQSGVRQMVSFPLPPGIDSEISRCPAGGMCAIFSLPYRQCASQRVKRRHISNSSE